MGEQRKFEKKNIVNKAKGNPKQFHIFIRSKLSVKKQIIRLRDSKGRGDEDMKIYEELNAMSQSVFIMEGTFTSILMKQDWEEPMKNTDIIRYGITRPQKDSHSSKAHGPNEVSP